MSNRASAAHVYLDMYFLYGLKLENFLINLQGLTPCRILLEQLRIVLRCTNDFKILSLLRIGARNEYFLECKELSVIALTVLKFFMLVEKTERKMNTVHLSKTSFSTLEMHTESRL